MASFVGVPGGLGAPTHGFVGGASLPFYDALARAHNDTGGNATADAGTYLSERFATWYIPACALAGVLFALYQVAHVSAVRVHSTTLDDDDTEALLGPAGEHDGAQCCVATARAAGGARRGAAALPWARALHRRMQKFNARAPVLLPLLPAHASQTSCVHALRFACAVVVCVCAFACVVLSCFSPAARHAGQERSGDSQGHQGRRARLPAHRVPRHHQLRGSLYSLHIFPPRRWGHVHVRAQRRGTRVGYGVIFHRAELAHMLVLLSARRWKWKDDPNGVLRSPKVANGLFSALSFALGAVRTRKTHTHRLSSGAFAGKR
jgi:hypothetical protein